MNKYILFAIIAFLGLCSQAEAANSRDLEAARNYALSNHEVGVPYIAIAGGDRIVTTVLDNTGTSPNELCRTYSQQVVTYDRRQEKNVVEDEMRAEACYLNNTWIVLHSREHRVYLQTQTRMTASTNPCRTRDQTRSQGRVQTVARQEVRRWAGGKDLNVEAIVGEMLVSRFFADNQSTTTCRY